MDSMVAPSFDMADFSPYPVVMDQSWLDDMESGPYFGGLQDPSYPLDTTDPYLLDTTPLSFTLDMTTPSIDFNLFSTAFSPSYSSMEANVNKTTNTRANSPTPLLTSSPSSSSASSASTSDSESIIVLRPKGRKSRTTRPAMRSRQPHNKVEKNYRDGINATLQRLQRAIPRFAPAQDDDVNENDNDGTTAADTRHYRPTKCAIMQAAINYIQELERARNSLREENAGLRGAVCGHERLLEKLAQRKVDVDMLGKMRRRDGLSLASC